MIERLDQPTPLNIEGVVSFDEVSNALDVEVNVAFVSDDIGDFRINCILTESGITGYPQANYYNDDPTSYPELYQAGNPIVDYEHNHVVRAMLGGAFGVEGIIPFAVSSNDTYSHEFNFTIPQNMDPENMDVIIYVSKHPTDFVLGRNILNAQQYHLSDVINSVRVNPVGRLELYPNPATDRAVLKSQSTIDRVMIHDQTGHVLQAYNTSATVIHLDISELVSGLYFVKIYSQGQVTTKKLVVE